MRKTGCVLVWGRCMFYSSVSGPPVEDPSLNGIIRSGVPRDEEAPKYIGPSMSIRRR